jgi:uncharacterized protein YjbI with pentapeptide repeats
MTNPQAGEHDVGGPVTTSPQAEDHDAAAAICGEKSHTVTKQLVSRSKQSGRFKRLWRWINREPPWWVSQIFVAVLVGLLVGGLILFSGNHFSDLQARHALQLENLRFVRDRVAATTANGRFPFAHLDLEGQDLTQLPLAHADFRDANLSDANLSGADLTGADLSFANLRDAWLPGARLDGANLCGADLTDAIVYEAFFRDAVLVGANLTRAFFDKAALTGAKFSSSDWEFCGPANLTETNLCSSNLAGADLKAASNLTSAKLNHIHYDEKTIWPDGFRPPTPSEALSPGGITPFAHCFKP